jgi:hypothetical protein
MATGKTQTRKRKRNAKIKFYSYNEFRRTFYPDSDLELPTPQDPKAFGRKLGEEAVKKIKQQAQARANPSK